VTADTLGYLHANCAQCHNPVGSARPYTDMDLRVRATDTTVDDTGAYRTAVDVPLFVFRSDRYTLRIASGDPDASAVVYRMSIRGTREQMPPIASERVDDVGIEAVRAWITGL